MKKNNNKTIETIDRLVGKEPLKIIANSGYIAAFMGLLYFILLGITMKILASYFEVVVFMVLFVFCFRETLYHAIKLPLFFNASIICFALYGALLIRGIETSLLKSAIIVFIILFVLSVSYRFVFRKYLVEKLGKGQTYF